MIVAQTDVVAIIASRLAQTYAPHLPINIFPPPIPLPSFEIRISWHERCHHDPAVRWFRKAFVDLYRPKQQTNR